MLSLDIKHNKSFAEEFKKAYLQHLIDARDRVINNGIEILINKKKKRLFVSKANRKFLQKRLSDKTLENLILFTPKQQRKIIKIFKNRFPSLHSKKTKIYQFLKYIFITSGYDKLDTNTKNYFIMI